MIRFTKVSKTFATGAVGLSDVTLLIEKGEFVFVVGPTGSGKTTLFRLLIREVLPSKGSIVISDFDLMKMPSKKIPQLRRKVGIVFQDLKLLFDRTILENVLLPLEVTHTKQKEAKKKAEEVLSSVGILVHKDKFPIQLSGGELQRVAIARALVLEPEILLADEPTGNLDPKTSLEIVSLLTAINKKGTTVVMATHNVNIVDTLVRRVVALEKGRLVRDEKKGTYGVS